MDEESALSAGLLQARWERQRDQGLSYSGDFLRVGGDYLPRLGFQSRTDFRFFGGNAQYKIFTDADSPLRSAAVRVGTGHYYGLSDERAESRSIQPQAVFEFKGGTEVHLTTNSTYESVGSPFTVAGASSKSATIGSTTRSSGFSFRGAISSGATSLRPLGRSTTGRAWGWR